MSAITDTWLDERITATKAAIVAHESAILALSTTAIQSYTLDTGQTRQTVTKAELAQLRLGLHSLYDLLATLSARRCGSGTRVTPGF